MHTEALNKNQIELIPLISSFSKDFYLAGGTALALQIGHRRSIDFDLFSNSSIKSDGVRNKILSHNFDIEAVLNDNSDEFTIIVNQVKLTFLYFPFAVKAPLKYEKIRIPEIIEIAALKAYALGRRAKWKDYVDLFFIFNNSYTLIQISQRAGAIFGTQFNEKLFREQLCFFEDIDYSEKIEYIGKKYSDNEIKNFLCNIATTAFI